MASPQTPPMASSDAAAALWRDAGLDPAALARLSLPGATPVLPSSFAVDVAAQASIGVAALAASEIGRLRGGGAAPVEVPRDAAALECSGHFSIDGRVPAVWDKVSGLYPCGAGGRREWVRIHANFAHHRDGALRLLGLPAGDDTGPAAVREALTRWRAEDFESAAARAGLVVAAARSFDDWDASPAGQALAGLPLITLERIGDADPIPFTALPDAAAAPLAGLRVLDLTRILAGPVCGRSLAAYGADVMLVNSPHLPNIEAIADTSRGKLSVHLDLDRAQEREALGALVSQARVFVQGYRPGALAARGFDTEALIRRRPGLVVVNLSAYGHAGPWADRRGFDSLVQTATGFNLAEAQAAGSDEPRALPVQILDYASGFLMAFGALAALQRQAREGGSWQVRVALARTGLWLRSLGRVPEGLNVPRPSSEGRLRPYDSGFGRLMAAPHAARIGGREMAGSRPSMPPGSHPPRWP